MNHTAILSNDDTFTSFAFNGVVIRFRTSKHLQRYTKIKKWDDGYIEVMAKYDTSTNDEEEYIDLIPVLENLYFDPKMFLKNVKEVKIKNE